MLLRLVQLHAQFIHIGNTHMHSHMGRICESTAQFTTAKQFSVPTERPSKHENRIKNQRSSKQMQVYFGFVLNKR